MLLPPRLKTQFNLIIHHYGEVVMVFRAMGADQIRWAFTPSEPPLQNIATDLHHAFVGLVYGESIHSILQTRLFGRTVEEIVEAMNTDMGYTDESAASEAMSFFRDVTDGMGSHE